MAVTIQFESHSNELSAALEYENDPDCQEYHDQFQPSIPLEYLAKNGSRLHILDTADFFVLWTAPAGWVECKTVHDLATLTEQSPERFRRAMDGTSHCPPEEGSASVIPTRKIRKQLFKTGKLAGRPKTVPGVLAVVLTA